MSAIQMNCNRCGQLYMTGVVGTTAWPPHACPQGTPTITVNIPPAWVIVDALPDD